MAPLVIVFVFFCRIIESTYAETPLKDLPDELKEGRVILQSPTGLGVSSGNSVKGYLVNDANIEISVDISFSRPIFLRNQGRGQNMIATTVLLRGGRYSFDGARSFITLKPKLRTEVDFVAYCVDFEKDNPTQAESFDVADSPSNLDRVTAAIQEYSRKNPNTDITSAAQAAIWMAQGVSIDDIRTKFPVSSSEEILARSFLR